MMIPINARKALNIKPMMPKHTLNNVLIFKGLCVKLVSDRLRYAHLGIQIRTSGRVPDQDPPVILLQS